ncbi:MAG: magnesium chelatase ATPase subunit D [Acidobacteriota bacterium]
MGSSPGRIEYPFAAVAGRRAEKHALLLLAAEPRLRGVLIAAESASACGSLARAFGSVLPDDENRALRTANPSSDFDLDTVQLPINITEDSLLGGLELERTLATGKRQVSTGLLARANGRVLYVDDVNLLEADTAAHLGNALDCRQVRVEREGVSAIHDADFLFVGAFGRAEGEPSALLRDRVGLIVSSGTECSADETVEMIDRAFRFDDNPSTFAEDFAFETAGIKSVIENARAHLPRVRVSKDQIRQIALVAIRLGVEGNRADVFALQAARANAALAGRDAVNEDDVIVAIQLVLAPRATTLPSAREKTEKQNDSTQQEDSGEGSGDEARDGGRDFIAGAIEDLIIQTIDAELQKDLLSPLQRTSGRSRDGKRFKPSASMRGRYVRSTTRRTRDQRVAVDATLRAAAPFQLRRRMQGGLNGEQPAKGEWPAGSPTNTRSTRVKIEPEDLRFKEFKRRSGIMFILAVDASGSMALNRMAHAKGALTRLLAQAYLHRDNVALISFRGAGSEVLLAPTRSVELAKRLVDAIPAGGGTPLSAGVVKAIELARLGRLRGVTQAMLVLFTDGRANVSLREGRTTIGDELRALGQLLRSEQIPAVVVDTKSRFVSSGEGDALARMLGASYVYLPRPDVRTVYEAIASAAGRTRISDG